MSLQGRNEEANMRLHQNAACVVVQHQNMADAALLRDGASLSSLGTMMRSWCKKRTFCAKNYAHQHDTEDRMEAENKMQCQSNNQIEL